MAASAHGALGSDASPSRASPSDGGGHGSPARPSRPRGARPGETTLSLLAIGVATTALACLGASHLIWNRTASLPLGLYLRSPKERACEGELVALRVPPSVRPLVHDRRYLADGSLLIKPVAAVAGDVVCTRRGVLTINGAPFGPVLSRDSLGRALPVYEGCGALPDGQVFLASHHPGSFDSRSFGPVDIHALKGSVTPLWTY